MAAHNPNNERIKRRYFVYLKEAKRHSEATIDAVARALSQFEADTKCRDFKAFHVQQAVAFKRRLAEQRSSRSGRPLSKATLHATLMHLKRFFQWLAGPARVQVPIALFRCGVLQLVRQGHTRCDGETRTACPNHRTGQARHFPDA